MQSERFTGVSSGKWHKWSEDGERAGLAVPALQDTDAFHVSEINTSDILAIHHKSFGGKTLLGTDLLGVEPEGTSAMWSSKHMFITPTVCVCSRKNNSN